MRINTCMASGLFKEDKDTNFSERMKLDIYLTGRLYTTLSRSRNMPFAPYEKWLSRYKVYLNTLNK